MSLLSTNPREVGLTILSMLCIFIAGLVFGAVIERNKLAKQLTWMAESPAHGVVFRLEQQWACYRIDDAGQPSK